MPKQRLSQKQINRELTRISRNVPEELIKNLMSKEKIAPTIKEIIGKALGPDIEITEEQRARYQNLIDSGVLDREVEVLNPDTESAISAYYDAEIALAVKLGRLPKEAPMPGFIKKKGIKYARKQRNRLEQLFSADEDSEGSESSDDKEDAGTDSARNSDDRLPQERAG